MQEIYKGYKIVIAPIPRPSRVIGRHGLTGKGWVIKVNNEDVTYAVLRFALKDIESVMIATKKYVDEMMI